MNQHNYQVPEAKFSGQKFDQLLERLLELNGRPNSENEWPTDQLSLLADPGVMGWVIPEKYGGIDVNSLELTVGYERLSSACLSTAFVMTQRNGACQRIAYSENEELKSQLLPALCRGELFATVGISHLTTSRQHLGKPAVEVTETNTGFRLTGTVPWVTGADHADYLVTGGALDDGRQLLTVVPMPLPGIEVQEPFQMLSMTGSHTGAVLLKNVEIEANHVLFGPVEGVMKQGQGGGTGSLATSALALGTTLSALRLIQQESEKRPELSEIHDSLMAERNEIAILMYAACQKELPTGSPTASAEVIRQRANSLVLRATQACLTATKGAGFVSGHPAERLVREAMFFMVWSCPIPVMNAALREFACVVDAD